MLKKYISFFTFLIMLGMLVSVYHAYKDDRDTCYLNKIARVDQKIIDYCK